MANRKVSIWTYKKVDGKWRYGQPIYGRNNKIKPEPNAVYYIRWYVGRKPIWQKCRNAADATIARERQEAFLSAHAHGFVQQQTKLDAPKMVSDCLNGWLEEYRLGNREESYKLMKHTLYDFFGHYDEQGRFIRGFLGVNIISQVRKVDLLRYR